MEIEISEDADIIGSQEVDNKTVKGALPWMFHLCYILELVIDGFGKGLFSEKQLV